MLKFVNKSRFIMLLIIFFLISCIGCSNTEIGNPDTSSLFSMNNDAELETYLQDQYIADFQYEESNNVAPPSDKNSDAAYKDNIISISSSKYRYDADAGMVMVFRIENNERPAEKIAEIETFGKVIKLLLNQNILIVIQTYTDSANSTGFNSNIQTGVLFINISNPAIPERLKSIKIDGRFLDNILNNEKLYIIQQFQAEIDLQIKQQIEDLSIEKFIPYYAYIDDSGQSLGFSRLVKPDDLFRPAVPSGSIMTIVTVLNIKDMFKLPQSIGFIGNIKTISTNSTSIYLNESTNNVYKINITKEKLFFTDLQEII